MNKLVRILLILSLLYVPMMTYAQRDSVTINKVSAEVFPGYVFNTHPFFGGENTAGKPIGATLSTHLKYSFKLGRDTDLGRLYPNTFQGIGLAWNLTTGGIIGISRSFEGPGKSRRKTEPILTSPDFPTEQKSGFRRHMTYDLVVYGATRKRVINIDTDPVIISA